MYDTEGTWTKNVSENEPPRTFFVMHKTDWSTQRQIYTNDAERVAAFMLARRLNEYQLYINNREYSWGNDADIMVIAEHIKQCAKLDEAFYPPDEFPRHHWFE